MATVTQMKKDRKAGIKPEAPKPAPTGKIVESKATTNGSHLVVTSDSGDKFTIKTNLAGDKEFAAASAIGRPWHKAKALADALIEAAKSPGQLAKGLDARSAPHSAKAVADRRAAEKPSKPAPAAKKEARKAEKAAKAAPKADDKRAIKIVDRSFVYGKEGTSRRASWDACVASCTVADYAAKGGALKYLARWAAAGAIKLG